MKLAVRTHSVRMHRIAFLMNCAFAAGALVLPAAPAMATCNSGPVGKPRTLMEDICQADASGQGATAVGGFAIATGGATTAIGSFSKAQGENATAVGYAAGSTEIVPGATSIGAFTGNFLRPLLDVHWGGCA
jgi:hypothetical protein